MNKIQCPKCSHSFEVSDVMSSKIKAQYEAEFSEKEAALNSKLSDLSLSMEREMANRLKTERAKIEASLTEAIKEESRTELSDLQSQVEEQASKLKAAQDNEIKFRQAKREVEEEKRTLELTLTRRLDEEREKVKGELSSQMAGDHALKAAEWEKKRADMEKMIDELRRKAEQSVSQQLQGEVLELEVEAVLKEAFVHDSIEPVAKGVKGGDVLHRVLTRTGQPVGAILWEVKRTKHWTDTWIPKLKDDQREVKAEVAVIITAALPEGITTIGMVDGVWVTTFQAFTGLALALRASLLEVNQARLSSVGKNEKMEVLYSYLSGPEFRGRVETIIEAFTIMKEDLESEKRATERAWAKRDKQLVRVISGTSGMFGELQGIIGSSLQDIPALTMETK